MTPSQTAREAAESPDYEVTDEYALISSVERKRGYYTCMAEVSGRITVDGKEYEIHGYRKFKLKPAKQPIVL